MDGYSDINIIHTAVGRHEKSSELYIHSFIELDNKLAFYAMLSSLVKEHQAKQAARKETQEQKRKEAMAAANNLTQALVDHLNVGVAQAYLNQKRLDAEAKQLHHNATNFAKQTQQWVTLVESFSSSLKEIGDAENWARSIEDDMQVITRALEYTYQTTQERSAAAGSSGT